MRKKITLTAVPFKNSYLGLCIPGKGGESHIVCTNRWTAGRYFSGNALNEMGGPSSLKAVQELQSMGLEVICADRGS